MKTKTNQAKTKSEVVKQATKRLGKSKGNRRMKYTIAMFLATGGMPWMI